MSTFERFEPVFNAAQGQLESSSSSVPDLLPFLFCLRAKDKDHLQIHLTDFHANTWFCDLSTEYLEEKKDEIGIGGAWENFVTYVRAAFASDNVKIFLDGPTDFISTQGATSARVVGQKSKGTPKIWVTLAKLKGSAAGDAMGAISIELYKDYFAKSVSLSLETSRAVQLSKTMSLEKARGDRLQDQLDALSFAKKKRRRPTLAFLDPLSTQALATQSQLPTQFLNPSNCADVQSAEEYRTAGSSSQMEPTPKPGVRIGPSGPRIRTAPAIRRPKRRGTVVAAEEDNKE